MVCSSDRASPPRVRVDTRRVPAARLDRKVLRRLCTALVRGEGVEEPCALNVTLVGDAEIARLNARHRGIDGPTDVLSFPLHPPSTGTERDGGSPIQVFVSPPGCPRELGDVVVSYPRAVAQAKEYGHAPEREIAYLISHGLLHILGHDHETDDGRALMREREEAALAQVGLART